MLVLWTFLIFTFILGMTHIILREVFRINNKIINLEFLYNWVMIINENITFPFVYFLSDLLVEKTPIIIFRWIKNHYILFFFIFSISTVIYIYISNIIFNETFYITIRFPPLISYYSFGIDLRNIVNTTLNLDYFYKIEYLLYFKSFILNILLFFFKIFFFINFYFNFIDSNFVFSLCFLYIIFNIIYLNLYLQKAINLYIFLLICIITFLLFGLNSFIGFLILVEISTITFIVVLIFNFSNFFNYIFYKNYYYYLILLFIFMFIDTKYYYYFNFNINYIFYYKFFYLTLWNDFIGMYMYIYGDKLLFLIFVALIFLFLTFGISLLIKLTFFQKILYITNFKQKVITSWENFKFSFFQKIEFWNSNFDFFVKKFK